MKRALERLADREFDVVVVGGGVVGAALAWECAARDLSVALLERGDFGGETSANSFRIVHGGIRYLQHGDVARIRESCAERSSFLRIAPHLVRPLPILVPTYRGWLRGRGAMRCALTAYDLLTFDRNRGVRDDTNCIPRGRILSRAECLALYPGLDTPDLTGAAVFHDGQMYNPTRLVLSFVRSAVDAGALAANHLEVDGFLRRDGRVLGATVRDRLRGERFEVRGRITVNAAGPWAERLLQDGLPGVRFDLAPTFSRDACLIVRRRLPCDHAIAVQGATRDPDAILSRGERHLFLVPWREFTLVGVWHVVHRDDPDRFTLERREIEAFLREVNAAAPWFDARLEDVSRWNAGLVLFGENEPGRPDLSYGKRSWIVDHDREHGVPGLITVIGVRYTTARGVARRTVDLALQRLGMGPRESRTDRDPIWGGDFASFSELLAGASAHCGSGAAPDWLVPLLRSYGSHFDAVLRHRDDEADRAATIGSSLTLRAEVRHAVREEMAETLADVVLRRTDLATGADPGDGALRECAQIVAHELGWDTVRTAAEVQAVRTARGSFPGS